MKRSEMIGIMKELFTKHMNSYDCQDDGEMYSRILADLESVGMLPPFSSEAAQISNQIDAAGYEWEEEDETK